MIGKTIRGARHLARVASGEPAPLIMTIGQWAYDFGYVFKENINGTEMIFVLNNTHSSGRYSLRDIMDKSEIAKKLAKVNSNLYFRVISDRADRFHETYRNFIGECMLLTQDSMKAFEKFVSTEKKFIKHIYSSYDTSPNSARFVILYHLTNGSKNLIEWGLKVSVSIQTIKYLIFWSKKYKQLVKELAFGTITAYTNEDAIRSLVDETVRLRRNKRVNDAIMSFNTAQKKVLKAAELSESDKKTLSMFTRLSKVKQTNFIQKMSTVEDFKDIMGQMRCITHSHFNWDKDEFMEYLKNSDGLKFNTVYDNGSIVLVEVFDYDTIKILGKTTNWCISKNKSYWNTYMCNGRAKTKQYVLFDFSQTEDNKLSIIGITTEKNKGITAAHNFTNDNLMVKEKPSAKLKTFISDNPRYNGIYSILNGCGIEVSMITDYDIPPYEFKKESLLAYLYECVSKDNVDVLSDNGDKLVLLVEDSGIRYFIGPSYLGAIMQEYWGMPHILFIDFSINKYDPNKIRFGIITEEYDNMVPSEQCNMLFDSMMNGNKDFNSILDEFGLPYNTISRPENNLNKFISAFYSFSIKALRGCVEKDKAVISEAFTDMDYDAAYEAFFESIFTYYSFDYLDLLYKNGYQLMTFLDYDAVESIISQAFKALYDFGMDTNICHFNMKVPTNDDIKKLYQGQFESVADAKYVFLYLVIKKVIENERGSNKVGLKLINALTADYVPSSAIGDSIVMMILNNSKLSSFNPLLVAFAKYVKKSNSEEILAFAKSKAKSFKPLAELLESHDGKQGMADGIIVSLDMEMAASRAF